MLARIAYVETERAVAAVRLEAFSRSDGDVGAVIGEPVHEEVRSKVWVIGEHLERRCEVDTGGDGAAVADALHDGLEAWRDLTQGTRVQMHPDATSLSFCSVSMSVLEREGVEGKLEQAGDEFAQPIKLGVWSIGRRSGFFAGVSGTLGAFGEVESTNRQEDLFCKLRQDVTGLGHQQAGVTVEA